ncbi:MAG: signal peptidase I [Sphaerobacteraceae bacterium]|nr:MAG: signal peptidase I [Sphaerobacteraceae bacterium]
MDSEPRWNRDQAHQPDYPEHSGYAQAAESASYPAEDYYPEQSEQEAGKKDHRATAWEIIETILLALLIFLMVRGVVINFRVDGNSMEPTLSHSEMLVINRRAYTSFDLNSVLSALPGVTRQAEDRRYIFNPPQRGDIVVFTPPGSGSDPYIKRIIGLPGETVDIRDGSVWVNDMMLEENYVSSSTSWRGGNQSAIVIPEDEFFVLGDNRENSSDSRSFGTVPKDDIIGKSWVAYWPPGSIQVFPRPSYALE